MLLGIRAPHVEVARKLMTQGWHIALGDKVAYVIAKGAGKLFQKAKPSAVLYTANLASVSQHCSD
jgi:DNA polymerase I